MNKWQEAQNWESEWWGNCSNTYTEETKQLTYARKMGLTAFSEYGHYPVYDLSGKSVLDLGGGPTSLLLKCKNFKYAEVRDPCNYPEWIRERYVSSKISYFKENGETIILNKISFNEVWIYNVLQHVISPQKIIENARSTGSIIRIFEWVDMPPVIGHPHELKEKDLNKWLGGEGKTEQLNENGCYGRCYYGIFKGNHYEEKV